MTTFKKIQHIEIKEKYQGINLTEFSYKVDKNIDSVEIINKFIQTKSFVYDSLRDCIKNKTDKGYLGCAFNFDKIKIEDFKKFDKAQTSKFLNDYLNEPDWGEDKNDFAKLLEKYLEKQKTLNDIEYFIISKSWFNNDDDRLIEPESWAYIYYFLIISIDKNSNSLILAEWTYD
jgi:hypothetical protein